MPLVLLVVREGPFLVVMVGVVAIMVVLTLRPLLPPTHPRLDSLAPLALLLVGVQRRMPQLVLQKGAPWDFLSLASQGLLLVLLLAGYTVDLRIHSEGLVLDGDQLLVVERAGLVPEKRHQVVLRGPTLE